MPNPIVDLIALIVLTVYPSIPIVLMLAHGFIKLWRKLGRWSFAVFILLFAVLIGMSGWLVLRYQEVILGGRLYDTPWSLFGIVVLSGAFVLGIKSVRTLTFRTLVGIPEILSSNESGQELVVKDIYRFVRHPRYLEFILELLGVAILSGLAVNYLLFIVFIPLILIAAKFEERELRARFGQQYAMYRESVGMFLPKLSNS